ncbi:UDP-N-acetylmuramate dehydrogenase [Paenibacillus macquariensis]|uniref:UDP-N-acetylenolpyruvoylglucosamine reductase n=1 Tax=Paenibacillus macquariensis TaxID=948756 RepID=A0ABY1JLK6_9BACL|nr:UDP-N-acetylmuramate dehydrogenase [Paenibacillus macquariensis]MEC0090171.1 UDP-N-acetylmuramate dehydrogenase [Paenibacillus macquariensis]OAB30486.1 UDP-N-acetylenolpyruvoylglucosamine reductase [Paenibacillus macquariensis subsp. macquariensis]SIQ38951.1 UDP-N-acetylmuramate dehydrogenase [Paenibacillus macquariensis]
MQQWTSLLLETNIGEVHLNEPMTKHTTWRIGGPVDAFIVPETREQLQELITLLHHHGIPWIQIGRGSNMLVSDKGIRGVVIKLGSGLEYAKFQEETVTAGGGCSFVKLSFLSGRHGLTGLEFAGGIPGSVGGAVYMNAGAHGSDVSRIFKSAEIVLETGELVSYAAEEMDFAYRHSVLHERKGIVVEATIGLKFGERREIAAALASYKDRRRRTQPLQMPCAGSVFRNPTGDYAARLIEAVGLKGYRVGGAEISLQHANFIVNTGQATAEDVLTIMHEIQKRIDSENGISLVPEVFIVGER